MKLNQVIAIVKGKKSQSQEIVTKLYQTLEKKSELFSGISRIYRPKNEDGDKRPPEKKIVQQTVPNILETIKESYADMINMVATLDIGNCIAKADVVIDGKVILKDVPATHLICLEKQVGDISTFISKLPILDIAEEWKWNSSVGYYTSEPRETTSSAKVVKFITAYEATEHHPAQIKESTMDEIVGYWTTTLMSGNIKADDKKELLNKIRKFSDAVKIAREEANSVDVKESNFGTLITEYLFSDIK